MKLLEPGRIGSMEVKNRIVMSPMTAGLGGVHGEVTSRVIDWYEARAKGGAGLICVEETLVTSREKDGLDVVGQLRIDDWNQVPGWSELVDAVHFHGAKISVQLNYTGPGADPKLSPGVQARVPSEFSFSRESSSMDYGPDGLYAKPAPSREMGIAEIEALIHDFEEAAFRAKKAGFDAVEIICYHGGPAAFLSPYTNKRTDAYGGDIEGRMRFPLEILRSIKRRLGEDFPVFPRIPADEFMPGGIDLEEAKKIARKFEENGADAISVASGTWGTSLSLCYGASWPTYQKRGFLEPHTAEIKKVVHIPVFMVGAMHFFEMGERILDEGKADFIVMGRGLIADPEIPKKLYENRTEDIRRCIRCNECLACTTGYTPVHCSVNPMAGNEKRRSFRGADNPKKVLVVGGGPGGMEAARVAAVRGHDVTLIEKDHKLGGNMVPGSVASFKEEIKYLIDWYDCQLSKAGVTVELNLKADVEEIAKRDSDVVILATGSKPIIPDIQGCENACHAIDIFMRSSANVGDRLIIVGGGTVGCETALYLKQAGKHVTILEMMDDILSNENPIVKVTLTEKMIENGVEWLTGMRLTKILADEAIALDATGEFHTFHGKVVLAMGMQPVALLADELRKTLIHREYYKIGDCVRPRDIFNAIHEGFAVGSNI